ncbi:MAG: DUF2269 family protein [Chloroflexi bacterium]|nr:DUF2269 family protein [Chloroflexota bacterium]
MAWEYLKFFHIVFVLTFFSGTIVSMMTGIAAAKAKSIESVAILTGIAARAAKFVTIPSFILVGIFGVLTASEQNLDLTGTGWLNAAYVASILGFILGLAVLTRHGAKAAKLAARDAQAGKKSEGLEKELNAPLPKIVGPLLHLLVAYIIVLMVFQPYD